MSPALGRLWSLLEMDAAASRLQHAPRWTSTSSTCPRRLADHADISPSSTRKSTPFNLLRRRCSRPPTRHRRRHRAPLALRAHSPREASLAVAAEVDWAPNSLRSPPPDGDCSLRGRPGGERKALAYGPVGLLHALQSRALRRSSPPPYSCLPPAHHVSHSCRDGVPCDARSARLKVVVGPRSQYDWLSRASMLIGRRQPASSAGSMPAAHQHRPISAVLLTGPDRLEPGSFSTRTS